MRGRGGRKWSCSTWHSWKICVIYDSVARWCFGYCGTHTKYQVNKYLISEIEEAVSTTRILTKNPTMSARLFALTLMVSTTLSLKVSFSPSLYSSSQSRSVTANNTHYEDPKPNGCRADEEAIQISGVAGDFCTPQCVGTTCPTDVPPGVTATPTCALQDASGNKFCALMCTPGSKTQDSQCGATASCKPISGIGICTYDD